MRGPLIFFLFIIIGTLLTYTIPGNAQHYYNYYNYNPPQYNYQQPYYNNNYQYYYPAQKVVAQEIAVAPLIVTVPVESKAVPVHAYGSPYYYSSSEAYKEKAYLREVIRDEFKNLLGSNNSTITSTTKQTTTSVSKPKDNTSVSKPTNPPGELLPDTATPQDLQQKVLAAFNGKGNCLNCHADGGSQPFKLTTNDEKGNAVLLKHTSDKRWKIYGMASVGAMPPAAANDAGKAMEAVHLPNLLQYAAQKD